MEQAERVEAGEDALRYTRVVPGPRGRVFRAWTTPAEVEAWFAPPPLRARVLELDARPGGRFRFQMREPSGATHTATGSYLEVAPPERLVFTWRWEEEGAGGAVSRVTVLLLDRGHQTEVVLAHELLPGPEAVRRHLDGWRGCLAGLAAHLG